MECIAVDRILHLSAFVVAISIAYLGYDKFHAVGDDIVPVATHVARIANDIWTRLQPISKGKVCVAYDTEAIYIIAYLGQKQMPRCDKSRSLKVFCWLFRHSPMFRIFLNRHDSRFVFVLFIVSISIFFYLSSASVYAFCPPNWIIAAIFYFLIVSSLTVFYSLRCAIKMNGLGSRVERLKDELYEREERAGNEHMYRKIAEMEAEVGPNGAH